MNARIMVWAVAMMIAGAYSSASAATLFEKWSEETAVVRIDADGKAGWIHAVPEKGRKRGRFLGMFGSKLADLTKVKLGFNEGCLWSILQIATSQSPRRSFA